MRIEELASSENLLLAWRRITTGGNTQYKKFYRDLYYAYEISVTENLEDLRRRLLGRVFHAHQPERIYLPKSTGLHRPLSLLYIEDQIVLQAFANIAAVRLFNKRAPLQLKTIYSNILQKDKNIFFFKRWQLTYEAYKIKIQKYYDTGFRWVADFDLAAFYDTISHELLFKTIYPRKAIKEDSRWLLDCLRIWSSAKADSSHGHGLPQGPIASDFLAECFLLPIDLCLKKSTGYIRYVDDVRLFGNTEDSVRLEVVQLEKLCRERGLIPQTGKFAIKRAQNINDAMGMLPSISDPQHTEGDRFIQAVRIRKWFLSSIAGKPLRVKDKTRLRFVLYRAEPDSEILRIILRLIPHHPEHADAFFHYLGYFNPRKAILRICLKLIDSSPYPYLRGEAWHVLARYIKKTKIIETGLRKELKEKAIGIAKKKRNEYFMEKWGACHFLVALESVGEKNMSRYLNFQCHLLQSFLAPVLPDEAFAPGEVVVKYLQRSAFEPGLSISGRLCELNIEPQTLGINESSLHSQVHNTMSQLGLLVGRRTPIDTIAEILKTRYGLVQSKLWYALLGSEYYHALGLLKQAEAAFNSGPSYWLSCQNSFNNIIFSALQKHLAGIGHPAACKTTNVNGVLIDFGVMLEAKNTFTKNCPQVGNCFKTINERRNHLPASHPYEKKTAKKCRYLKTQERNKIVGKLVIAYKEFARLMP